ncbi:MAG: TIGR03619 family F420-dependent LLM class oxidoreductase [Dehalococcoidia bacterium]
MKIGVSIRNLGGYGAAGGIQSCLDMAVQAERLGYDSVWVADHVVLPEQVETPYPYNVSGNLDLTWQTEVHDPLVLISALAQATERIEIGTAVLIIPYRHPLMVAKMLSTADRLSDGRIILGAGAGWLQEEFSALGLSDDQFAHRGSVTNDYLRAIKEAWLNTGPSRYAGAYVTFSDVGTFPHPVRMPHIPIWVGGKGRHTLRRAVRLGDGYLGIASTPEVLRDEVAELRRLAEKDRRDPAELTVALIGGITITQQAAPAERAPLSGTLEQIREDLQRYEEAGLQHLVAGVRMGSDSSLDATLAAMQMAAAEILPRFRDGGRP